MSEKRIEELAKFSYKVAFRILKDIEDARDLSQTVILNALEKGKDLENKGAFKWIETTTINDAATYAKIRKKTISFASMEEIITKTLIDTNEDIQKEKYIIIRKNLTKCSYYERDLLLNYINLGGNIKKLSRKRKESYPTLKKKIYRLKKDVLAEYYQHAGMIGTKKIINSKLHKNIRNFIKQFKNALETNSLDKMRIYFGKKIDPALIPDLKIERIHDYNINLREKNNYRLIVFCFDTEKKFNCYFLEFKTYKKNRIRITKLPKLPKKITKYNAAEIPEQIMRQLEANDKGVIPLTKEQIIDLLKDYQPI